MNEKEFIQNVWDLLAGNTQYCTTEQAREKYKDLLVEVECSEHYITLRDEHNEWRLSLQKVWCDETQVKHNLAECTIVWKDSGEEENVIISLDGSDNDGIFFVCQSAEEFANLTEDCSGEDFDIVTFKIL